MYGQQGYNSPLDYLLGNAPAYQGYRGPVYYENNTPQAPSHILSGVPNTETTLPPIPRNLPPAPIPARVDYQPGGVADLPETRIPIPWLGPEHFFDPGSGMTYRMGHGGRVRITGHLADWDPVDQWAAVLLTKGEGVPQDAGISLGTKANANRGRAPSEQLAEERPQLQQIGGAIDQGAREVRFGPYAYSGLASTMPKVGPIIAGTIGNAIFPGLGVLTAAADSAVNQAITRGGDVNWREVGGQAVGGAAGAAGGYVGAAGAGSLGAGPIVSGVAGGALGGAASSAARQGYFSGNIDWSQVGMQAGFGAATGGAAGAINGGSAPTFGSVPTPQAPGTNLFVPGVLGTAGAVVNNRNNRNPYAI